MGSTQLDSLALAILLLGWRECSVGLLGAQTWGYRSETCLAGPGTSLGIKGTVCWAVHSEPALTHPTLRMFSL